MPQNMIGPPPARGEDVVCHEGGPSKAWVMEEKKEQEEGDPAIPPPNPEP